MENFAHSLPGRAREITSLAQVLERARQGVGSVLVVRGPRGIGKTALLDHAVHNARDLRVLRIHTAELESAFGFAGLHQLFKMLSPELKPLPEPQHNALRIAFGAQQGAPPDPHLIGLATLQLLADASAQKATVCIVDDIQWLDAPSTMALAFAARRLSGEQLAMLFGEGCAEQKSLLTGFPEMNLEPLTATASAELLASVFHAPLSTRVLERLVSESRGNPRTLVAEGGAATELAGGYGIARRSLAALKTAELKSVEGLSSDAHLLLLLAAAEPMGDPALFWQSAQHLEVSERAVVEVEASGLLEIGAHARFCDPGLRARLYGAASMTDRRRVHSALWAVVDAEAYPDWSLWHRAHAASSLDSELSQALSEMARHVVSKAGVAAAVAFLRLAANFAPESGERFEHVLNACELMLETGSFSEAIELLDALPHDAANPQQQMRLAWLSRRVDFRLQRTDEAAGHLALAVRELEQFEPDLVFMAYLEAMEASLLMGSEHEFEETMVLDEDASDWPSQLCAVAFGQWNLAQGESLLLQTVARSRASGARPRLQDALSGLADIWLAMGRISNAQAAQIESDAIAAAMGSIAHERTRVSIAALQGHQTTAEDLVRAALESGGARGERALLGRAHQACAMLYNGLGQYAEALRAGRLAWEHLTAPHAGFALRELVEAAALGGDAQMAHAAFRALRSRTQISATPHAQAVEEICAALLTESEYAEGHYRNALQMLEGQGLELDQARSRLLFGEWLRRQRRRDDAREQLRIALDGFSRMGADAFFERAARELRATGERSRPRSSAMAEVLTPQELHVARLAATGRTSKHIAAELLVSPRTVDSHLRNAFLKLGVTSRRQLDGIRLRSAQMASPQAFSWRSS